MDKKLIPGTQLFYASKNGKIFDYYGNERTYYHNNDGYKTVSVKTLENKWITFGVHRLVAMAWLDLPNDYEIMQVNHKDTNKENNSATNLEWTTSYENNIHSSLIKSSSSLLIIGKNEKGNLIQLGNLYQTSQKLNVNILEIWNAVKNKLTIKGLSLSLVNRKRAIPKEIHKRIPIPSPKKPKQLKLYNLFTKEIIEFPSIGEIAKYLNISKGNVCRRISTNLTIKPIKKEFLIFEIDSNIPIITKEYITIATEPKKREVLAYSFVENEYIIYESASMFIRESGLSKKAVTVCLKNKNIRRIGNWVFVYFKKELIKQLKEYISMPG